MGPEPITWFTSGTSPPDLLGHRALHKGWALTRWAILVVACGLGVAAIVVEAVVGLTALVGH
jgi:hypothetical protein